MCGIFALFLRRPLQSGDINLGRAGRDMMRHRGPDSGGEWMDAGAGVFLGHRRLSIIDLSSASQQPMVRGGSVIAFNGEIYNYRTLRERLASRVAFTTKGDTEVLLRTWQAYGEGALDLVEGMFALAIWNQDAATVATDRFGEKPLYYATAAEGVYVSSELPPLVSALRPDIDDDPTWRAAFMGLGFIPSPRTAYRSIRRLGPGEVMRIVNGVAETPRRYWQPPRAVPGRGRPQPLSERDLDKIQGVLVDSVLLRLEADVEPCVFLSGGVDSSLVAAIIARDLDRRAATITVSFPDGATHDEGDDGRDVAQKLGLDHELLVSNDTAESVGSDYYFGLFGQPSENLTSASVHQMARLATERGFRLGISGVGADEVFLGYLKHKLTYEWRYAFGLPQTMRLALAWILAPLQGQSSSARTFRDLCGVPDSQRYLAVKNLPAFAALATIPDLAAWAEHEFGSRREPLYAAIVRYDLEQVLVSSQLTAIDHGSMRASLEMRTPFLSRNVQDLIATFDPRSLLAFGQKSVLRRLLRRYLPDEVAGRRKRGFSFPPDRFLLHYPDQPQPAGVPAGAASVIWRRRDEARAWRRLATRLVLLDQFPQWVHATAAAPRPAVAS